MRVERKINEEGMIVTDILYDDFGNVVSTASGAYIKDEEVFAEQYMPKETSEPINPEPALSEVLAQILLNQAQIMVKIKEMEGAANE